MTDHHVRPMSLDYALNHIAHVHGFLPSDMTPYAALCLARGGGAVNSVDRDLF